MTRHARAVLAKQSEACAQFFLPLLQKAPELITHEWDVLARFWRYHDETERTFGSISIRGKSTESKLRACARHLFMRYEVPKCLREAFTSEHACERDWYVALAKGRSVRETFAEYKLTKREAHALSTLEFNKNVRGRGIVRFAQAQAAGATRAQALRFAHWASDLERLEVNQAKAIMLTLIRHKASAKVIDAIVPWCSFCAQDNPRFSLGNANYKSVRSRAEKVQKLQNSMKKKQRSGAQLLRFESSENKRNALHYFVELSTAKALVLEGEAQANCVGSYWDEVRNQESWIFSLRSRLYVGEIEKSAMASGERRHVTIEVEIESRQVLQVYGKANRDPHWHEVEKVRAFCEANGYLWPRH